MSTGEVQMRAYANMALLIASVIVHYADKQRIQKKKKTSQRFAHGKNTGKSGIQASRLC